ncbi:crossover junction endodeoxyribonuclease RuvC [Synergistaceae bacterium OttesenSCG-928-D05]|nr:crossover junction endodeoxyribonuclease RuvC [Synergistaceae bacterium OttesenSCG-928-D05]
MRCLGIDPGLGTLGYGFVTQRGDALTCEGYGVIKTPTELSMTRRLSLLYDELRQKADEFPPDIVAIEKLFFGRNVTTAEMVWQARGVVLLFTAHLGIEPYEPKPAEVKMAVCGNGTAEKGQVQGMVAHLLGLSKRPSPDDAADALAIAITGLSLASFDRNLMRGY